MFKYKILDYIDGPQLVLVTINNKYFICVFEHENWFLGAELTEEQKDDFINGKIDLRSLYLKNNLYKFSIRNGNPINPILMNKEEIKEEYLPLEGYYYKN